MVAAQNLDRQVEPQKHCRPPWEPLGTSRTAHTSCAASVVPSSAKSSRRSLCGPSASPPAPSMLIVTRCCLTSRSFPPSRKRIPLPCSGTWNEGATSTSIVNDRPDTDWPGVGLWNSIVGDGWPAAAAKKTSSTAWESRIVPRPVAPRPPLATSLGALLKISRHKDRSVPQPGWKRKGVHWERAVSWAWRHPAQCGQEAVPHVSPCPSACSSSRLRCPSLQRAETRARKQLCCLNSRRRRWCYVACGPLCRFIYKWRGFL